VQSVQQVIELLIPQAYAVELVGYGENDMIMPDGQSNLSDLLYPLHLFGYLTFRAMPVATAIV